MLLEVITPDKKIYTGEVKLVQLPGTEGSFEIMNNHAPIISTLKKGKVKIQENNQEIFIDINGGVVEVLNNKIILLAEQ